jgi:hypothetical protein
MPKFFVHPPFRTSIFMRDTAGKIINDNTGQPIISQPWLEYWGQIAITSMGLEDLQVLQALTRDDFQPPEIQVSSPIESEGIKRELIDSLDNRLSVLEAMIDRPSPSQIEALEIVCRQVKEDIIRLLESSSAQNKEDLSTSLESSMAQLTAKTDEILSQVNLMDSGQNYQKTGWTAPTGTATKTGFATHVTQVISNPPTQAEVQAIDDSLVAASEALKALIDDFVSFKILIT